jgi:kynurenine formamidase
VDAPRHFGSGDPEIGATELAAHDLQGETRVPVHHLLLERGVVIVEGLELSAVPAGSYQLVCLPLRLAGLDGAPARVALID